MKKAALITGAGSGIGAATALEFAKQGYFVYLLGRNKEKLQAVAIHCENGASVIGCDLLDLSQVQKKIGEILATKVHRLEVLVNNAGTFAKHSTVEGTDEESDELWLEQFQVHLLGALRVTRLLIPYFSAQGKGSIVNVSSSLALKPRAGVSAYAAMKAAQVNWTESLALELASQKIRVNVVCPGMVDTPIHDFHGLPTTAKEQALQTISRGQPTGRIGQPEEVARAIYFLASDHSSWTTGASLAIDGGSHIA